MYINRYILKMTTLFCLGCFTPFYISFFHCLCLWLFAPSIAHFSYVYMYPKLKIMAFNFYGFSFNLCQCKLYSININMVLVWECMWKWLQYEFKNENTKNIETETERMEKRWNEWNSSPLDVHLCKISSGKSLSKHCTQVLHIHLYALSMANGFWRSFSP